MSRFRASGFSCFGVAVDDSLVGTEVCLSRFKGLLAISFEELGAAFEGLVTAGFEGLVTVGFEGLVTAGFEGLVTAGFEGLVTAGFEGLVTAAFEGLEAAGCSCFCLEGEGTFFAFSPDAGLDSRLVVLAPSFFASTFASSSPSEDES